MRKILQTADNIALLVFWSTYKALIYLLIAGTDRFLQRTLTVLRVMPFFRTVSRGAQQSSIDSWYHRHGPVVGKPVG